MTPESKTVATPRLEWRIASIVDVKQETARARTLVFDVPQWPGHRAGQHVDVRLTADDGYQAQRSYSIASSPEQRTVALTIERLENGEVSSYLCDAVKVGDSVELRGPIGGYFLWQSSYPEPLLLVGGGSGIVPLMAMLRHHARADPASRIRGVRLLQSFRTRDDIIYRKELEQLCADGKVNVTFTLTREASADWKGYRRRIDKEMLEAISWPPSEIPRAYICGPTPLVELVASILVELGHDPARVRTERFGPTG